MAIQELDCDTYIEQSDNTLISLALLGNDQAFDALVWRYHLPLFNFIRRCVKNEELAHDTLQFVFMKLYMSLSNLKDNLRSTRTTVPLKSWLFQVAWNRCMDELRRQRMLLFSEVESRKEEDEISMFDGIPDDQPLPDAVAENRELELILRRAINKLPPRLRPVVLLRYTRELSFVEIGRILNMPENTAKTYFQRARPYLRAELMPYVGSKLKS
ncbi:MAG TPA: sigma-70 family RNA polymerase sigma factor [Dictyobacter sp.]|jgi:RNA polymerase sigma-70 factor (ECF subfamily)|nr:sigma-70 family RNA polymerase sigma factor [Dictyobacter sp.]